jgi:hypothetical protein
MTAYFTRAFVLLSCFILFNLNVSVANNGVYDEDVNSSFENPDSTINRFRFINTNFENA